MASDSPSEHRDDQPAELHSMLRLDLLSGVAFSALGLFMAIKSWYMPRLEHRDVSPFTVPGIVTGVLGGVLLVLGIFMIVRAAAKGGWRFAGSGAAIREALLTRGGAKLLLTLGLTLGYAAGLVGRIRFEWATILFLFVFILLFEWNKPAAGGDQLRVFQRIDGFFMRVFGGTAGLRIRTMVAAAILATVVAFTVVYVFQEVFRIRLP